MLRTFAIAAAAAAAAAHKHRDGTDMGPLNPVLGIHGYPDCVQPAPFGDDVDANQLTMVCKQRGGAPIKIACVGDSITAGAHASNASMAYPEQLQRLLDPTMYAVTNLGACGSTMQKKGDSPYWQR